jgi:hypothetical protein
MILPSSIVICNYNNFLRFSLVSILSFSVRLFVAVTSVENRQRGANDRGLSARLKNDDSLAGLCFNNERGISDGNDGGGGGGTSTEQAHRL